MRKNGTILAVLLVLSACMAVAQSSVGALGKASDAAQRVFDGRTQEPADTIYDLASVEVQPRFPGGDTAMYSYLARSIVYPEGEGRAKPAGRIYVGFIVRKDGRVDQVTVRRGVDPALDAEAVRAVRSMPNWTPGLLNGEPVATRFVIPMVFVAE